MILLPIGHDEDGVRRRPWATLVLIALCVAGFLLSGQARLVPGDDLDRFASASEALTYQRDHAYLEFGEEFEQVFLGGAAPTGYPVGVNPAVPVEQALAEQAELDLLVGRALEAHRKHPFGRWGVTPGALEPATLISYMFLHAGWMHLFSNLLLLYLAGPFVEDGWGRPLFVALFATAGVVAALVHAGAHPGSPLPLVGASGAVAGVLGAFLVHFARVRIRFFYMFGLFLRGTFHTPAWLILPLWFLSQLLLAGSENRAGVAHTAHVGGFVVGASFGLVVFLLVPRALVSRIRSRVDFSASPSRCWQGASTREYREYSEEKQRSQRREGPARNRHDF